MGWQTLFFFSLLLFFCGPLKNSEKFSNNNNDEPHFNNNSNIIVVSLKSIIMQGDEKNTHTQQHEVLEKIGLVEGKLQIRTAAAAAAGECQLRLVLYHATPQQRPSLSWEVPT